jgi:hypothetical protein
MILIKVKYKRSGYSNDTPSRPSSPLKKPQNHCTAAHTATPTTNNGKYNSE